MDRSISFTLLTETSAKDSLKQFVKTTRERPVFGQVSSVSRDEFFAAGQSGFRPELRVTMFAGDYFGEKECVVDGERFSIYRTYFGRNDTIELYLEKRAGDHETGQS